jgi:long-subunit acyl-CoA synthetase (AMP-forming)
MDAGGKAMSASVALMSSSVGVAHGRRAVIGSGGALSYGALLARSGAIAKLLHRHGIRRFALAADNGPDWLAANFAAQLANAVCVPLPAFFSAAQLAHVLADSGVEAIIADAAAAASLRSLDLDSPANTTLGTALGTAVGTVGELGVLRLPRRTNSAELPPCTAKISYTSGTTGQPKGVCLPQALLDRVAQSLAAAMQPLGIERHLCLLPLATLLENVAGVYAPFASGAEVAVPALAEVGFGGATQLDAAKLLACIARYEPGSLILLPQMLALLVHALERGARMPASLRFVAVGGAHVAATLLERARRAGLPAYEGYGLTECGSVVALNTPAADKLGSVGKPLPHARVHVAPDGEIGVAVEPRSGYLGQTIAANPLLATGDLGHRDADGFVHLAGRRKNVFITSFGRNVSPEWVEGELTARAPIAQAALFGEARPWNVAVVVPRRPGLAPHEIDAAVADANAALPDYARAAHWLPAHEPFTPTNGLLTANGRIRRAAIWERYGAAIDRCYSSALTS